MQKCAMPRHICLLCELPEKMLIESYELNLQGYLGQQKSNGGGALCVQMDFTRTFEANAKCNNINHV